MTTALPGPTGLHQRGGHPPDDRGGLLPVAAGRPLWGRAAAAAGERRVAPDASRGGAARFRGERLARVALPPHRDLRLRSEEHTSELQSPCNLVCRLLLEKKKIIISQLLTLSERRV